MKSKLQIIAAAILAGAALLAISGCGTSANLAGASVSVDVAQKGMAAGLTLAGGTNSVAVGVSYAQGTNNITIGVVVPTGK